MRYLQEELKTFREQEATLRKAHSGDWVVISGSEVAGVFKSFQRAAEAAVAAYQDGQFLIRQIDAPEPELPLIALASI